MCEITKANFEAGLLNLDQLMGKIGSLSIKAGKVKTASDDLDDDLKLRHKPTKKSNPSASSRPSKAVNRARRPVILSQPQSSVRNVSSKPVSSSTISSSPDTQF